MCEDEKRIRRRIEKVRKRVWGWGGASGQRTPPTTLMTSGWMSSRHHTHIPTHHHPILPITCSLVQYIQHRHPDTHSLTHSLWSIPRTHTFILTSISSTSMPAFCLPVPPCPLFSPWRQYFHALAHRIRHPHTQLPNLTPKYKRSLQTPSHTPMDKPTLSTPFIPSSICT